MAESKYSLLLWNKKWGKQASFVVKDNEKNKFSEFTVGRVKDMVWVDKDISKDGSFATWDDFQNEPVDDLNLVEL